MRTGGATQVVGCAPHRIERARLRAIVLACWEGHGPDLEEAVDKAVWDGHPPVVWGQWPPLAKQTWDDAVHLYNELRQLRIMVSGPRGGKPHMDLKLGPVEVWTCIRSILDVDDWPNAPWLTLAVVSKALGCTQGTAAWRMRLQGWAWEGRYSVRRVLRAPCLGCGISKLARKLNPRTGLCEACDERRLGRTGGASPCACTTPRGKG